MVDFPLFEWNADEKRYDSLHHPFTAPVPEDLGKLETDPGHIRSQAYDIVVNGSEIGGGSVRIQQHLRGQLAHPDVGDQQRDGQAEQHRRPEHDPALLRQRQRAQVQEPENALENFARVDTHHSQLTIDR